MTLRIDTVVKAGYVESVELDEESVSAVVAMLGIPGDERARQARARILRSLEDLATRRVQTVRLDSRENDRTDLDALAANTESHHLSERVGVAIDHLDSLRRDNPVLFARLEGVLGGSELHEWLKQLESADHFLAGFGQRIERAVSILREQVESENRRGRPPKLPERAFASNLYRIWVEFTDRGTSRQNAYGRVKDPFGDFVDAAGKLIDPDFKGHDHARQVHEAARDLAGESERGDD